MRSLASFAIALGVAFFAFGPTAAQPEETFDPGRLEKEVLVRDGADIMGIDVLADRRVLFIERAGGVRMISAEGKTATLGKIPVAVFGEVGLQGVATDPDFARTGWAYFLFCPASKKNTLRISRFTIQNNRLSLNSEKQLVEIPIDIDGAIHMGGGLAMDRNGNLYAGVGDNCPPIPEVPTDIRPGKKLADAFRSAANSRDLRGHILRIHPEPDGSFTVPKDNLFADGKDGRPEIFAIGCRNPFRLCIDHKTGWLFFGDVGPNIAAELGIGPEGYDEINLAKKAGNFGWPQFTGPNEPWRSYDFATKKPGEFWDVKKPINPSPNNTGLRELPPPLPALLYYPTGPSKEFPAFGTGGRSAMAGPVYYVDATRAATSKLGLPAHFDRTFFVFEWMRNWIKTVKLDADYRPGKIEAFMPTENFRKPIDIKVGPDGALYLAEYGDRWSENPDGTISRIVYRRGNRPPVAIASADVLAGKQPLNVRFDSSKSFDKDAGDKVSYSWTVAGQKLGDQAKASFRFDKPGTYKAELTVADNHGAASQSVLEIRVGNAPPKVRMTAPTHGSFFDWGQATEYAVEVDDAEDGSTADGRIPSDKVSVRVHYRLRAEGSSDDASHPGLAMMRKSTCFACHGSTDQSKGPPYAMVARKYQKDPAAKERLAKKIVEGGAGAWGAYPMPPHPQHSVDQTRQMVDWILTLTAGHDTGPMPGKDGVFAAMARPQPTADYGQYVIAARYVDLGAQGVPALAGDAEIVLHSRKKRAAFADLRHGMEVIHELDVANFLAEGMIAHFRPGDWIAFKQINLQGIGKVTALAAAVDGSGGEFELRADGPDGPLVGKFAVDTDSKFRGISTSVQDPGGVRDLYVVAKGSGTGRIVRLVTLDFADSPEYARSQAPKLVAAKKKWEERQQAFKPRAFIRLWTETDLAADLAKPATGRDLARGQRLFKEMACASCHKIRGAGGTLGPDLSDVFVRLGKKEANARLAVLREILQPSRDIDPKYQTSVVITDDGLVRSGIIVSEDPTKIVMAADIARPDDRVTIPRDRIEGIRRTKISLMPAGVLNTLSREEILDLLHFIEANEKR